MPNPFFYGGRVDPDQFIGRKSELLAIFNCLEMAYTGQMQSISVVGPHRMGRSSLLYFIATRYANYLEDSGSYRFAYISLHNPDCHTPSLLLLTILRELQVSNNIGSSIDLRQFQQALDRLKRKQIRPIVCLDEFEELLQTGAFDNSFFDAWRSMMSDSYIAFVIASTKPLCDLVVPEKYTSSFFNIFTLVPLGEFSVIEAEDLVRRGQQCDEPFTTEEASQMRALGGHHPYKLQVAGEKIYSAKRSGTVDWKQIRKGVESQLRNAGLLPKSIRWDVVVWQKLLDFLRSIGYGVLELRRSKNDISPSTALWWGIIVIVIAFALLLGVIPLGYLFKAGPFWFGK